MSEDLKKALAVIGLAIFGGLYGTYSCGTYLSERQAKAEKETATFQALSPEKKLHKKIRGITELNYGTTLEGINTLQLTITQRFPSSHLWFTMTVEDYTRAAFTIYPDIELLDIKINLSGHDTYGQAIELPGLLYEMTRTTYQKIKWESFNSDNLPRIAERWTPLHHQLKTP